MEHVDYTKLTPSERRACRLQYIEHQKNICIFCNGDLSLAPPETITSKKINWNKFPKGF